MRRRRRQRRGDGRRWTWPGAAGRRAGLAGPGGAGPALPARHQRARERPGRPRHHRRALRRRPGGAHPPGDRAGHRRHARAGGAGHPPAGLPHERGPLGLPGAWSGSASSCETHGLDFREARAGRGRGHALHHPHAGAGRHRPLPAGAHRQTTSPTTARSWASTWRTSCALGRRAPATTPTSRSAWPCWPCATSPRRNGVSRLHGRVTARMMEPASGRTAPRRDADRARSPTACTPAPGWRRRWPQLLRPLPGPALAGGPRRPATSGSAWSASPTRSCGARTSAPRERLVAFAREQPAGAAERAAGAAARSSRPARGRPAARRPHHRLRPPLRHLQAGHPAASATSDRLKAILLDEAPAGAAHLRRQGPSPRRRGQGAHPRDRSHFAQQRGAAPTASSSWRTTT